MKLAKNLNLKIKVDGLSVLIDPRASNDVQEAIKFYDEQRAGLGRLFEAELNKHLQILQQQPFFHERYDAVRCLPLKKYPYMIHFTIDESRQMVNIVAVFHTALNPKKWKKRED